MFDVIIANIIMETNDFYPQIKHQEKVRSTIQWLHFFVLIFPHCDLFQRAMKHSPQFVDELCYRLKALGAPKVFWLNLFD